LELNVVRNPVSCIKAQLSDNAQLALEMVWLFDTNFILETSAWKPSQLETYALATAK
jgi:hypothetical protein